eukprot:g1071.t1
MDVTTSGATKSFAVKPLTTEKLIVFVRHGISTWNEERRIQGSSEEPKLTSFGEDQALLCKKAISQLHFDSCFSSPLPRAQRTAELIWSGREGEFILLDDLKEANLGILQGQCNDVAAIEYSNLYRAWRDRPEEFCVDGRYPVTEVFEQAKRAWQKILASNGVGHLVVTHKSILRALLCTALGLQPSSFRAVDVNNGGICVFRINKQGEPMLTALNLTSHLHVVLSRPVTALGDDPGSEASTEYIPFTLQPSVEGTYRWLSSYIVRFEPRREWAADLEVDFEWNLDLETYDGVPFTVPGASNSRLTTPTLSLTAVNVVSNETNYLTDNYWDAFVGTRRDILPEVPKDGFIELRASSDMKLGALQNFIRIQDELRNTPVNIQVVVEECSALPKTPCIDCIPEDEEEEASEDSAIESIYGDFTSIIEETPVVQAPPQTPVEGVISDCANVSFTGEEDFIVGRKYALILPSETNYSNDAGALKRDIRIPFGGLREFRIPFVETKGFNVSSPVLDIWLPHGLDPSVNISKFPMKIVRSTGGADVDFSRELITKSILRVTASLTPGVTYRVTAFDSTSVFDGYGQRLRRSVLSFLAAPISPLFKAMDVGSDVPLAVFEEGENWGRKIIAFAKGSALSDQAICKDSVSSISLWDVDRPIEALPLLSTQTHEESVSEFLGISADQLVSDRKDLAGETPEFELDKLLRTSGIVATQYCRNEIYYPLVIVESSLQVAVLGTGAITEDGRSAIVWVTDMKQAKPVSRASVTIFRKSGEAENIDDDYKVIATTKTGKNGVGMVSLQEDASVLHALVEVDGKNIYVPHIHASSNIAMDISDSIILDRRLVKPGETLHIKGYVMENRGGSYVSSNLKNYRLIVSPSMSSSKREQDVFDLDDFDKDFGSYTYALRIPTNVPIVPYTIRVAAETRRNTYLGRPHPFVIADPRQPPVVLTVDAPHWAVPNKDLKLNTQVRSFVGAAVENVELVFIWSIEDHARSNTDDELSGRITSSTNANGEASASIPLSDFTVSASAGTVMEVRVQYSSPSGDFVEEVVSIRLEPADVDIKLERTVKTDIPGQEFGVKASVTDLYGDPLGKSTKVTSVTLSLKRFASVTRSGVLIPRPTTTNTILQGKAMQRCRLRLSRSDYCTFTIPEMGVYVVEACVNLGRRRNVCKRIYVGKTKQEWEQKPLQEHLPFSIMPTTEGPYKVGDTAEFLIQNPYENVRLLLAWGTTGDVSTETYTLKTGRSTFEFKVDQSCSNNCALSIVASIPRQAKSIANDLEIPVNSLFDAAMPHTEHYTTVIETVKDSTLDVKISVPDVKRDNGMPLIEPGLNASVRVDFDRKSQTEITVIAVDKAVLDLLPYPLKDVSKDFVADLASYFQYKSSSEYLVAPDAINAVEKANEARKSLDPWFKMLTKLHPSEEDADISLTDEEYIEKYVQYLTVKPRDRTGTSPSLKTTKNDSDEADEATSETDGVSFVGVQASYVTTSLFHSYTASGGEYLVNFEGPEAGGEFVIRAYASSGTGLFGSDEITVGVRKAISVTPDFPAFARLGDQFEAGIVIRISSVLKAPVTVTIRTDDIVSLSGPEVLRVNMGSELEKEVRLDFVTEGIGATIITVVADDGSGNSAVSDINLRVHGSQSSVVVGSAFKVEGKSSPEPRTRMDIPAALEGSGSIVVAAGTGQQPGILVLADQVRSEGSFTCPVHTDFALAMVAIPAILDTYKPWSPDPNLLPAYMVDLINAVVTDYDQAQYHLSTLMTSSSSGLEENYNCPGTAFTNTLGASLAQNAKGVFVVNEIEDALKKHNVDTIEGNNRGLLAARDSWIDTLKEILVTEAVEARERKGTISLETVALARAALGPKWNPPRGTDSSVTADISMSRLKRGFKSLSLEGQAYYILALLSQNKPDRAEISRAISTWEKLIYTSGDRAYIVASRKSVTPASNLANGLILFAMSRAGEKGATLERMATYVTAPVSDIYGFTSFTTYEKTICMFALAEYDGTARDKKPRIRLEVRSGTNILLQHVYTPERIPAALDSTQWEDLDKNPAPIEAFGLGSGEVNVALAMKFVPRDLLQYPVYKGIFVDRTIQLDSAGEIGEGVVTVPVGTVVNVKVQFMTPVDLKHTTVSVAMPAGLQPVQIGSEGTEYCPVPFFNLFDDDYYPQCPEQVTSVDEVHFLYETVSAGAHTVSFKAIAAFSGSFGLPATRVYVTNSPDIMGLSSAGRFDICKPGRKCEIQTVEKTFTAKQCNENCNDNGVCDLNSGDCLCFVGFGGNDCSKAST